jgi:hypothetical protein
MADVNGKAKQLIQLTRRDLLAGCVTLAAWPTPGESASRYSPFDIVTGCVFEDVSGNGQRRAGDRGLAGVMVSNGRDVVVTDADGCWRLHVRNGEFVFVVTPPNFEAQLSNGIPNAFHRYQPFATPAGVKRGLSGTTSSRMTRHSIDFPLRRKPQSRQFEALLFADMQPSNERELGYVRDETLASIIGTHAAFAINHGDVMGDNLGLFPKYRRLIGCTGITWHHCPGNHDMNLGALTQPDAFETWRQQMGPTHYAFQHGGATFIVLNNVEYLEPGRARKGGRGYLGRIGEEQLHFVRNVLRHVPKDQLVAVSMHIPLINFEDPLSAPDNTADRHRLLAILSGHPHTVSFSGHSHTTEHHYLGREHGFARSQPHHHHVLTAACGSWWSGPADARGIPVSHSRDGTPKGFHILTVDGNRYTTRFVATGCDPASSMRILLPDAPEASQTQLTKVSLGTVAMEPGRNRVLVDVFDGGTRTRVRLQIEGSNEPIEMERVAMRDPFVTDLFARHRETCKPWVEAGLSSHMWVADLPAAFAERSGEVTVRVMDEYGRTNTKTMTVKT